MRKNSEQNYLEQYERATTVIPNKLVEIQQWHDIATGITAVMNSECVTSSGAKQKMADAINECMDAVGVLTEEVRRLRAVKQDVIHTIEQIRNVKQYDILHKRYIQFISLSDIAKYYYDRDYTWVTTTHSRALKSVEAVLRERVN